MNQRPLARESVAIIGFAALAMFALALISPAIFNDGDTYWHIRAGQWMLAHRAVLTTDPFSLSFAGRPWQTQEWLAEIALATAFQSLGWSSVAILTGAAMAATAAMLATFLVRRLDPVPSVVVLVLALGCVMPDLLARPHILALPFTTIWIIGLVQAAEARRAPHWALLAAMALWVNLHGSFMFGLALIVPFAMEAILPQNLSSLSKELSSTSKILSSPSMGEVSSEAQRNETEGGVPLNALPPPARWRAPPPPCWGRKTSWWDAKDLAKMWALFAVAAVAVTFLNPFGLAGVLFPFHLMGLKSLASIGEWQSPDFHALDPVELAFFAGVFFLVWRGVRLSAIRLLLLLALAVLWLQHARYGMLLGITGAILLATPLAQSLKPSAVAPIRREYARAAFAAFAAVFVILATVRVAWPVRRVDDAAPALAAVPASLASLPVFNDYSFGGLLIFDRIRPLVDSRADFYGDAFLDRYVRAINADKATVNGLFRQYKISWTMLKPDDPLVAALDRRPGWRRLYADKQTVIQVGPDALAASGALLPDHGSSVARAPTLKASFTARD